MRSNQRSTPRNMALTLSIALFGCVGNIEGPPSDVPEDSSPNDEPLNALVGDELMALGRVVTRAQPAAELVELSAGLRPSAAAPNKLLALWVDVHARASYLELSRAHPPSGTRLPVGGTVVRALWSEGRVSAFTVLVQREAGFNPPSDLWFGEYDANGQVKLDRATNEPREGALQPCSGCHEGRADHGFVFGLPGQT
jgi:hypothetical protein